jgi:hypothetical protein
VIIPGENHGMCTADGLLKGDEYCSDELHLYRWALAAGPPQPVILQAHPGAPNQLDLRPLHPLNAPGGFSDQFVVGMEVANQLEDPQWEPAYQRALHLGYRLFPAFGSDNHDATFPGNAPSPRRGATVCWAAGRTRRALVDAMQARRCYYSSAWKPELRYAMRAHGAAAWTPMGGIVAAPSGRVDVQVSVRNDARNFNADPRLGKRFDVLELLDDAGARVATGSCARAADGADLCSLALDGAKLHDGAFYPRVSMRDPAPEGCRSRNTPGLLPQCQYALIGSAIYLNWSAYLATTRYRACRLGSVGPDRDHDGWPDDCDVCPDVANPAQEDADKDGWGDACPPGGLGAPTMLAPGL